jgi:hypothetical protein
VFVWHTGEGWAVVVELLVLLGKLEAETPGEECNQTPLVPLEELREREREKSRRTEFERTGTHKHP